MIDAQTEAAKPPQTASPLVLGQFPASGEDVSALATSRGHNAGTSSVAPSAMASSMAAVCAVA